MRKSKRKQKPLYLVRETNHDMKTGDLLFSRSFVTPIYQDEAKRSGFRRSVSPLNRQAFRIMMNKSDRKYPSKKIGGKIQKIEKEYDEKVARSNRKMSNFMLRQKVTARRFANENL